MVKGIPEGCQWKAPITKFDMKKLEEYKNNHFLLMREHPQHSLHIWNYTDKVNVKNTLWDEITLNCRGLVTDMEGNVVARSFCKFFNIEQGWYTPTDTYEIYEKLDGSLGILFYYNNEWIFTSRGSFESEQAVKGKEIVYKKHAAALEKIPKHKSYVFEIIYPSNKIIVDYQDKEDIIYLTSFLKDGTEEPEEELMRANGFEVVKKLNDYQGTLLDLQKKNMANEEGYVVRFSNGDRVKVKFAYYVKIAHAERDNLREIKQAQKEEKKIVREIARKAKSEAMWQAGLAKKNMRKKDVVTMTAGSAQQEITLS